MSPDLRVFQSDESEFKFLPQSPSPTRRLTAAMLRGYGVSWHVNPIAGNTPYRETHKTVNTRNLYGMLLCWEKRANKVRDN